MIFIVTSSQQCLYLVTGGCPSGPKPVKTEGVGFKKTLTIVTMCRARNGDRHTAQPLHATHCCLSSRIPASSSPSLLCDHNPGRLWDDFHCKPDANSRGNCSMSGTFHADAQSSANYPQISLLTQGDQKIALPRGGGLLSPRNAPIVQHIRYLFCQGVQSMLRVHTMRCTSDVQIVRHFGPIFLVAKVTAVTTMFPDTCKSILTYLVQKLSLKESYFTLKMPKCQNFALISISMDHLPVTLSLTASKSKFGNQPKSISCCLLWCHHVLKRDKQRATSK